MAFYRYSCSTFFPAKVEKEELIVLNADKFVNFCIQMSGFFVFLTVC